MGDIVKIFAKIGDYYLEDEKKVQNQAYQYDEIKTYLFDIKDKTIEPSLNVSKDELIITPFGVGKNSGYLFPNRFFKNRDLKDFDKFIKAIYKSIKNFLTYFTQKEILEDERLKLLQDIYKNKSFFEDKKDEIQNLQELKGKRKIACFSLSYQGKPISSYFKDIYEEHLNKSNDNLLKGYDFISNQVGIGGDANLPFCSVNELPDELKPVKFRLLPLSSENAKRVNIGFEVVKKRLSHNFYGFKIAVLPATLDDKVDFKDILKILENVENEIDNIRDKEEFFLNKFLEKVAENEKRLPVLNTILFYVQSNAAINLYLQIDDVLPSYISFIADAMGKYNIKTFKNKNEKSPNNETLYMHILFDDRLEVMNFLLSKMKIDKDVLIDKFSKIIYWGNTNKSYATPIEWGKYFNGYYFYRSIDSIKRYLDFLNSIDKVKEKFVLQKEFKLEDVKNTKDIIKELLRKSEFLDNDVLRSAYLLGMLSSAIINWQYAISNSNSFEKWLNGIGVINRDNLDKIWEKAEETIRKLISTSRQTSKNINDIKDMLIEYFPKALVYKGNIVKSSYISLAFAMGGSDFRKYIKNKEL